uniref:Uncharacterized protein n=1 Tax=Rhizophora mucronata TaxID=61149 RepID=A0A2P2QDF7_RHIMU
MVKQHSFVSAIIVILQDLDHSGLEAHKVSHCASLV